MPTQLTFVTFENQENWMVTTLHLRHRSSLLVFNFVEDSRIQPCFYFMNSTYDNVLSFHHEVSVASLLDSWPSVYGR